MCHFGDTVNHRKDFRHAESLFPFLSFICDHFELFQLEEGSLHERCSHSLVWVHSPLLVSSSFLFALVLAHYSKISWRQASISVALTGCWTLTGT